MSMPEKKPDRSHEAQELLIQRERQRCASIVSAHVDGQPADVVALLTRITNMILRGD